MARSIQAKITMPTRYLPCRAMNKHDLDGQVFVETMNGKKVWVAHLRCDNCGTVRIDVMKPNTCELIHRSYAHPDDYDTSVSPAEARKLAFRHMIDNGVSLNSLSG